MYFRIPIDAWIKGVWGSLRCRSKLLFPKHFCSSALLIGKTLGDYLQEYGDWLRKGDTVDRRNSEHLLYCQMGWQSILQK